MLRYDVRITVHEVDEVTKKHDTQFDWDAELEAELRETLERCIAINSINPIGDRVFEYHISSLALNP